MNAGHDAAPVHTGAVRDGLLLAIGGLAVRLGATDAALVYVKPGIRPLVVTAGVVVIALGMVSMTLPWHRGSLAHDHGGGHQPRVAWLLLAPVLAVVLVPPAPLGAFATRNGVAASMHSGAGDLPATDGAATWPAPPAPVDGAVPLSLLDFTSRAHYDEQRSLEGLRLRLIGFVSATDGPGFQLTRFRIGCCAADAMPVHVRVTGTDEIAPPVDTWVAVTGVWRPAPTLEVTAPATEPPTLLADSVAAITQPTEPYEF